MITEKINKNEVVDVYSGRARSCCCGCSGTYSYRADKTLRDIGTKQRGYEVEDNEVNERMISRIVNKLNKNMERVEKEWDHYFLEEGNRWYMAIMVREENKQMPLSEIAKCLYLLECSDEEFYCALHQFELLSFSDKFIVVSYGPALLGKMG